MYLNKTGTASKHDNIVHYLKTCPVKPIIPTEFQHGEALVLDMTSAEWADSASCTTEELIARTQEQLTKAGAVIAIGRYGEDRKNLYRRSELFRNQDEPRSIHLGIDLTVPSGTPVYTPLDAIVHSFADNPNFGDYGPTVILRHTIVQHPFRWLPFIGNLLSEARATSERAITFYTLYGHLSRTSLANLTVEQRLKVGGQIGTVGNEHENGSWPPHLHFQIIQDLQGMQGGYPGVCTPSETAFYFENCPDPNILLRISALSSQ